jgi:hypothetical protein
MERTDHWSLGERLKRSTTSESKARTELAHEWVQRPLEERRGKVEVKLRLKTDIL